MYKIFFINYKKLKQKDNYVSKDSHYVLWPFLLTSHDNAKLSIYLDTLSYHISASHIYIKYIFGDICRR